MPYVPAYDCFHGAEHNIYTPVHNSIHKSSPLDRTILHLPHFFTIYFINFNFNSRLIMLSTSRSKEWSYQYGSFQSHFVQATFFVYPCTARRRGVGERGLMGREGVIPLVIFLQSGYVTHITELY
jgi:hypothetical protein